MAGPFDIDSMAASFDAEFERMAKLDQAIADAKEKLWTAMKAKRPALSRESFEVVDGPALGTRVPVASDDISLLTLELENAVLASVHASFASAASGAPELEVLCDAGAIACSLLDPSAPIRVNEGNGWTELVVPAERATGPDHILGVRHFVRCVGGRERPLLTADHAAHVLDVIEAARLSNAEGRVVDVPGGWRPEAWEGRR